MKKLVMGLLFLALLSGCGKKQSVSFCEGVSLKGEGMRCGTTFSAGELTAMISADENFGTDRLQITVFEKKKHTTVKVETLSIQVKPEERKANANIGLYNEGFFNIKVFGKENAVIAEGDVEIVDTY